MKENGKTLMYNSKWCDSEQNSDGQGFGTANMHNFEYLKI